MQKSTYIYLIFLSFLFTAFSSVNSSYGGLAFFLGELVGSFIILYLGVLIISGAKELLKSRFTK
jgi:hypothetical protein